MLEVGIFKAFQSHKKVRVDFDQYATTFVGASDAGKTAVLRALVWVMLNRPNGIAFVKDGEKYSLVKIKVDGHWVTRKRGKGCNVYTLDGKVYKAFGNAVPPDIATLLNVSDVNFQRQHDSPFWFTDTPGQVSRNLNQIVNLSVIDSSLSKIATEIRSARSDLESTGRRLDQAKTAKKERKWVVKFDRDLRALETAEKTEKRLTRDFAFKTRTIADVKRYGGRVESVLNAIVDAKKLARRLANGAQLAKSRRRLKKLLDSVKDHDRSFDLAELLADVQAVTARRNKGDKVAERRRELEFFLQDLKAKETKVCELATERKKLEETGRTMTRKKCPLCGRKSSRSKSQTSTCQNGHQSPAPRKGKRGSTLPGSTSNNSTASAKSIELPW